MTDTSSEDVLPTCRHCGAPLGGYHHAGCDCDICPHGQALGCGDCRTADRGAAGNDPGRGGRYRYSDTSSKDRIAASLFRAPPILDSVSG
jgi:hypothetical protein